ncbi:hypothetical protein DTO006G1_3360 [Penicillium roqueforti]|uniref:uncharacterized protein n=1 Tax=Penicillium roqueforti TaxID=5082 RepID=UPI001909BF99|nr:uncharacterized protein LCP9604111_6171 [Penicillium roqueforti]KAF9247472.1 hypothetical protein LCP9604111_6171 [Penicillium roqueforti]KAI1834812.1 hypothetical protein CBS147337_4366 [Penicillium roqueforti]KAI2676655.1 hypothetical protein CBS147355_5757 [Penicillium roqueforti]KAI2683530.1 hypothetical protein LCP963914a_5931 [Penicillium roqueforti]KAI2702970.1 hypothetical protein CBS147372_3285 [Penicillium roqueforti]
MIQPGMFSRPDGSNIAEIDTKEFVHWVTVDFSKFGGRTRPNSGESMMRLMAEQCRSGVATITSVPQHHIRPCCLSLPVVGNAELVHVHILWRAAELADWHWEEIMAGKETLDTKRVLGDAPRLSRKRVNGA